LYERRRRRIPNVDARIIANGASELSCVFEGQFTASADAIAVIVSLDVNAEFFKAHFFLDKKGKVSFTYTDIQTGT